MEVLHKLIQKTKSQDANIPKKTNSETTTFSQLHLPAAFAADPPARSTNKRRASEAWPKRLASVPRGALGSSKKKCIFYRLIDWLIDWWWINDMDMDMDMYCIWYVYTCILVSIDILFFGVFRRRKKRWRVHDVDCASSQNTISSFELKACLFWLKSVHPMQLFQVHFPTKTNIPLKGHPPNIHPSYAHPWSSRTANSIPTISPYKHQPLQGLLS